MNKGRKGKAGGKPIYDESLKNCRCQSLHQWGTQPFADCTVL